MHTDSSGPERFGTIVYNVSDAPSVRNNIDDTILYTFYVVKFSHLLS